MTQGRLHGRWINGVNMGKFCLPASPVKPVTGDVAKEIAARYGAALRPKPTAETPATLLENNKP